MKNHVLIIPIVAALSLAFYSHDGNQSVANKRHSKLALFPGAYDRIEVGVEIYRQPRCVTPGTVWWANACWRPERIRLTEVKK